MFENLQIAVRVRWNENSPSDNNNDLLYNIERSSASKIEDKLLSPRNNPREEVIRADEQ